MTTWERTARAMLEPLLGVAATQELIDRDGRPSPRFVEAAYSPESLLSAGERAIVQVALTLWNSFNDAPLGELLSRTSAAELAHILDCLECWNRLRWQDGEALERLGELRRATIGGGGAAWRCLSHHRSF